MYRLYGRPGSGSVVVEAILETAGAPYEVELVEHRNSWIFSVLYSMPRAAHAQAGQRNYTAIDRIFLSTHVPDGIVPQLGSVQVCGPGEQE